MKTTEIMTLAIYHNFKSDVKAALQKICDKNNTYPFEMTSSKDGVLVKFARKEGVPSYKFNDIMYNMTNELKYELEITTVLMQRSTGKAVEEIPEEIKDFLSENESASEDDKKLLKKVEEDMEYFDSFAKKQILEADYDTRISREAQAKALSKQREKKTAQKELTAFVETFIAEENGQWKFAL